MYHIVRTHITGQIVQKGIVKVVRYEMICRNHPDPKLMVDGVNKDGDTIEIFSKCPECGICILQGWYDSEENKLNSR